MGSVGAGGIGFEHLEGGDHIPGRGVGWRRDSLWGLGEARRTEAPLVPRFEVQEAIEAIFGPWGRQVVADIFGENREFCHRHSTDPVAALVGGRGLRDPCHRSPVACSFATDAILDATRDTEAVLIMDECGRTGSQSEALMTLFAGAGRRGLAWIATDHSFIATGPAYAATLPPRTRIREAARRFLGDVCERYPNCNSCWR